MTTQELSDRHLYALIGISITLIGAAYVFTVRPDQGWTEDFALYIQHAKNILNGLPYSNFGTPFPGQVGVFRYPPGFPMILMPAIMTFGVDLHALKILEVVLFCGLLLVLALGFKQTLGSGAVVLVIMVGANPAFWSHKDNIVSDFPFLLMCFAVLALLNRKEEIAARFPVPYVLCLSVMIYFTYAIRSVGIILPLALITCELIRLREVRYTTLAIFVGAGLLAWIQGQTLATVSSYGDPTATMTSFIAEQGRQLGWLSAIVDYSIGQLNKWRWVLVRFFDFGGIFGVGTVYFYGLVIPLAAYGYGYRLLTRFSVYEIFLPGYLAVFMLTAFGSYNRYMMPVVIMMLFYMIVGLQNLPFVTARVRARGPVLAMLLAALLYAHGYSVKEFNDLEPGVESPDAVALFEFIRRATPADAVLLTQNPQATSLFTDRLASRYQKERIIRDLPHRYYHDHAAGWKHFNRVGATHVIVKRTDWKKSIYYSDQDFLDKFIIPQSSRFSELYRNDSFVVFDIR